MEDRYGVFYEESLTEQIANNPIGDVIWECDD